MKFFSTVEGTWIVFAKFLEKHLESLRFFLNSIKNWLSTYVISKSRVVTHDAMIRQHTDKNYRLIESAKISSTSLDQKMLESLFTSCQEENDLQQ